ncbi:uncharacterized protein STEHIDRAFT_118029 [Stereum hirsutum FP-91666 SS1]|uniref:uncharacterized protein n=1 Tax=Stereum hirsutum (strain FP-91666) TaxID=721885 RepID=UPI000440B9B5|nr:uncharacterized protein STEHIDRAFT_118029 [Stereum hirsutum FP-91666 SS1]EIM90771.1 hypothetical protein STEHIDRAFT_118029 [Stereum hirsutum FP-91666 SS1]
MVGLHLSVRYFPYSASLSFRAASYVSAQAKRLAVVSQCALPYKEFKVVRSFLLYSESSGLYVWPPSTMMCIDQPV